MNNKKNLLWAAVALSVAGLAVYFVRKRRSHVDEEGVDEQAVRRPNKHRTQAFSKAKAYANGATE